MVDIYIALEGIDGTGKSSISEKLADKLMEQDYNVMLVREPYTTYINNSIDIVKLINLKYEEPILSCLFAADRLVLLEKIENFDGIVISDRSKFSSYAYQGHLGYNYEVNCYMKHPDLIIYLDVPTDVAAERYGGDDKFENIEFLKSVRQMYKGRLKDLAKEDHIKWIEIDATKELEEVFSHVEKTVEKEIYDDRKDYRRVH